MQITPASSFKYKIQEDNGEKYVVIKKFIGGETEVVIPDEIDGLPVREIGEYAFLGRTGLTSVSLPERVKTIEWCAFYKCTGLTEFAVSEKNPNFKSIDGVLFTKDGRELLRCPLGKAGDYTVPKGVKTVRRFAFADCAGLTSVSLPERVKTIGNYAFSHCTGLTSVTLPEGVKTIGRDVFVDCSGQLTLPRDYETDYSNDPYARGFNPYSF